MAFPSQLPWLVFPLHWRHVPGWDLTLFLMLSARRKRSLESGWSGGVSRMLMGSGSFSVCQGAVMVFGFGLLHVSNL